MRECDVFIPYMSRHTYQISVLINMDAHVPTTSRFRLKFAGQTFLFGYLPFNLSTFRHKPHYSQVQFPSHYQVLHYECN